MEEERGEHLRKKTRLRYKEDSGNGETVLEGENSWKDLCDCSCVGEELNISDADKNNVSV